MPIDYAHSKDSELAQAIRDSDAEAFRTLYYRYYPVLYQFLCVRCHSSELARDFMQELFTRIWQTRKRLNPDQSLKAYLYRIAHNLSIDHLRKKVREHAYRSELSRQEKLGSPDIENAMSIRKAIENLPHRYRLVFELSRYEGLTYSEIALACGISIKTVESRMSQALSNLRKVLR